MQSSEYNLIESIEYIYYGKSDSRAAEFAKKKDLLTVFNNNHYK